MRDDGTEDTCKISGGKSDTELGSFVVVFFSFGEDVVIEELNEPLESNEFDDGVRNLSSPKRSESLIESANS